VNFGLLAAEILSLVWGTPANFNGFRVLAALLHSISVVGVFFFPRLISAVACRLDVYHTSTHGVALLRI